ncbi:MAG: hypothetical protein ABIP48_19180 [Planctomycetota bacterium]
MLANLFAFRTSWLGALVVLAGVFGVWLLIRAAIDFVAWFNEEILGDFRDRKRKKKKP